MGYNTDGGSSSLSIGTVAPSITLGSDGTFYGTTYYGGFDVVGTYSSFGTMFQMTTNGILKTLYSFNGTDGAGNYAAMTLASDGAFYGTTTYRVVSSLPYYWTDSGKIFQIKTNGAFTPNLPCRVQ